MKNNLEEESMVLFTYHDLHGEIVKEAAPARNSQDTCYEASNQRSKHTAAQTTTSQARKCRAGEPL
jgi:hypothetical protein